MKFTGADRLAIIARQSLFGNGNSYFCQMGYPGITRAKAIRPVRLGMKASVRFLQ